MTLIVEVISEETIKPSSPTPHHLRTLKFSLLDQYTASLPVPIILFYSANNSNKLTPNCLKASLSEILTQFYPLAGRITGNEFISCNDEGATFSEAQVDANLSQIVNHPLQEEISQFLPRGNPEVLLSIQMNIFDCGGIALAVCISHKVGDASSLALFINSWASLARRENEIQIPSPKFDLTSLFRPVEGTSPMTGPLPTEKVISKRFVFDASSVAALRAKCSNKSCVEHPTKVEAVSALIWKSCFMSVATIAVNLRGRVVPPLTNLYMGNIMITTFAASAAESQPELHVLAGLLHESIAKIGGHYVRNLQVDGGVALHLKSLRDARQQSGGIRPLWISSWCRFPFYEADFGSGRPVWTCPLVFLASTLMLMDTSCGKGVEAWVALNEEDMLRFESCPQLRDALLHIQK